MTKNTLAVLIAGLSILVLGSIGAAAQSPGVNGFRFDFASCAMTGSQVICSLKVTSVGKDRPLKVYLGPNEQITDDLGNTTNVKSIRIGNSDNTMQLVADLPTPLTVVADLNQSATTIRLMDLMFWTGTDEVPLRLRDIRLQKKVPASSGPAVPTLETKGFTIRLKECTALDQVLKCAFTIRSNGRDRKMSLDQAMRTVDDLGNQFPNDALQIGTRKMDSTWLLMAADKEFVLTITSQVSAGAKRVALIEATFKGEPDNFGMQFRNIPIVAGKPKANGGMAGFPLKSDTYTKVLDGTSTESSYGLDFVATPWGSGAHFTRAKESRITMPGRFPVEGTVEFLIRVDSAYEYHDFVVNDKKQDALLLTTTGPDVAYPGSLGFRVANNGTLRLEISTKKFGEQSQVLTADSTQFRFGEWHVLGFSYGSQGQYIYLDGKVVASNSQNTQTAASGGTQTLQNDEPTIGQLRSAFWANNRYDSGFEGIVRATRVSPKQRDWSPAPGSSSIVAANPAAGTTAPVKPAGGTQPATNNVPDRGSFVNLNNHLVFIAEEPTASSRPVVIADIASGTASISGAVKDVATKERILSMFKTSLGGIDFDSDLLRVQPLRTPLPESAFVDLGKAIDDLAQTRHQNRMRSAQIIVTADQVRSFPCVTDPGSVCMKWQ